MTNTFNMEEHLLQATRNTEELCRIAEQNNLLNDQQINNLREQTEIINRFEQQMLDHFDHMNMMGGMGI